jgi:hypothetical protein
MVESRGEIPTKKTQSRWKEGKHRSELGKITK